GADLEEARTADARAIPVTMCTQGNPGCHACRDAAQGLEVAAQVTVECRVAHSGQCFDDGAKVQWVFAGLDANKRYTAVVAHESGKATGTPTPDAYCPSGCRGSGPGDKLEVSSKRPKLRGMSGTDITYWSYGIKLYDGNPEDGTLIACADPEIIVDPPRGFVPPAAAEEP
ncbi:MAG TPA: hypothetical protein VNB06_22935, partial [Thermoanaerobaculia bacterium]|nr:hypothetical protein [Thermoanaerobaculia bacterium]